MSMILDVLEKLYTLREEEIEHWLAAHRAKAPPPVTCSVDLRHSGTRVAPVDNNLYPAGFNNLSPAAEARASRFFAQFARERWPSAKRMLIVPENHTRNLPYLDNLAALSHVLERAGFEAKIGNLATQEKLTLTSATGQAVEQFPLARHGARITTMDGFSPDVILLNNDCTSGPPPLLEGLAQSVIPPVAMGWYRRRKSVHFTEYCALAEEFADAFGIDKWLICAPFRQVSGLDFKAHAGVEALARAVDEVLESARKKYAEYGIAEEPYAFVKADGGTYGMGIMAVRAGEEILHMNKKARNKMQVVKEGAPVSEVIVQEGVPTADEVHGAPAEPMIYLVDGIPAGGMFRVNRARDAFTNLNAAGMEFTGMCDEAEPPDCDRQPVQACHFRCFGLVAAISALASGREMRALEEEKVRQAV